jgi:hypothetical protein
VTGPWEHAKAVGDAVLYEGYLLYPYRASAAKNKIRWQWGVLMPPSYAADDHGEYATTRSECLAEPKPDAVLRVKARFLQAQARVAHERAGTDYVAVPSLTVGGVEYTTWDESVEREIDTEIPVPRLLEAPLEVPFTIGPSEQTDYLGTEVKLVRSTERVSGRLSVRAEPLDGPFGGLRLRAELANTGDWAGPGATREVALHHALLAAHLMLGLDSGHFLSMLDPPEWAKPAVEACENERTWPVLIGDTARSTVMLCSPIILYDDPGIAAESAGELFDGTEIDEILTLRTMALTEDEKRQARATDGKARDLIDRVDSMPPELLDRLHGTVRYLRSVTGETGENTDEPRDITERPDVPWWDPGADASVSPSTDSVVVAGVAVSAGIRVRLRPQLRRADAQDMFLAGRVATVQAVLSDVDGDTHIAVTVDDDPAADLQGLHGRYRYFSPDEIEPLSTSEVTE